MSAEDERLARLALQAAALLALNELPERLAGRHEFSAERSGLRVRIVVWRGDDTPPDEAGKPLYPPALDTKCKRDALAVLSAMGASFDRRFVAERLYAELESRGLYHGFRTLTAALASLKSAGLLVNEHDRRGYGLTVLGASAAGRCLIA